MFGKIIKSINKLTDKVARHYRRVSFETYTGQKTNNLYIVGKIYLRNPNVHIGKNVTLYPGVMFHGEGDIYIGDNTFLCNNTIVYSEAGYSIHIGSDCMIAAMCHIINTDHKCRIGERMNLQGTNSENVVIGNDVWLASAVTVAKGSWIEDGAIIGAKAFVKGHVNKNAIFAGIPAKAIGVRK